MIVDRIEMAAQYRGLSARLDAAFEWLGSGAASTCAPSGRYEIVEGVFANCSEYQTKLTEDGRFETHRKYIDIQLLLEGRELIDVTDPRDLEPIIAYDAEKDIAFYRRKEGRHRVVLSPGIMAVLFPQDAHMPSVAVGRPETVRKVVVKVAVA
jgi:biofilm protein TabA